MQQLLAFLKQLDPVQTVATITAFALAVSKFGKFSLGFWSSMPAWAQRWLPGLCLFLGELPAALAGATTWNQIAMAALGALALATPGKHAALPPKEPKDGPPTTPSGGAGATLLLVALSLAVFVTGCGGSEPLKLPTWLPQTPAEFDAVATLLRGQCDRLDDKAPPLQRKVCAQLPPVASFEAVPVPMPSSGLGGAPGHDGGGSGGS